MNPEPGADRRRLLEALQSLLDGLPRPPGGVPPRAEDVLIYLETGRGSHLGPSPAASAVTARGDAAVEASLRLVIEAFTAVLEARGDPAGPG
ncbi:hypothetical protein Stsp02_48940 [Streptomyces sp. NBRC 14336]|uniref:hypothetical protein n=1 Tax=Streptomyces sp. NBRC 14336 TaxID=3030992 RepID=UPI0024A37AB0|nr:hypothetical protein [Streptomyces sp. NBRC 14336]WBO79173.1 hypothetical protein SBE_002855 [Streptomyces sp. SBE_14.2]GLW49233.1 hypothetical protein Stsp02_48940 [Streptomyces sp. NBRC 14336]